MVLEEADRSGQREECLEAPTVALLDELRQNGAPQALALTPGCDSHGPHFCQFVRIGKERTASEQPLRGADDAPEIDGPPDIFPLARQQVAWAGVLVHSPAMARTSSKSAGRARWLYSAIRARFQRRQTLGEDPQTFGKFVAVDDQGWAEPEHILARAQDDQPILKCSPLELFYGAVEFHTP